MAAAGDFLWRDGDRVVVFREGGLAQAPRLLAEQGWRDFDLLSTERALAEAPAELAAPGSAHLVPPGGVPEAAASILPGVKSALVVALGGGRVIDTAKAIAAARGGAVCALPTTLSGAEMTGIHRMPAGHEGRPLVRPRLVIADPAAMTSLPEPQLRASAMNALAHGADSLYTPFANPVAETATLRGAEMIATALDQEGDRRDRGALALGSILCAYALDSALFGLHHVVCQTLVRVCGTPHAETNARMLPLTMEALRSRAPQAMEALAGALGSDLPGMARCLERLGAADGHLLGLGVLGGKREAIPAAVEGILQRPELGFTPTPPGRDEIEQLIEAAW